MKKALFVILFIFLCYTLPCYSDDTPEIKDANQLFSLTMENCLNDSVITQEQLTKITEIWNSNLEKLRDEKKEDRGLIGSVFYVMASAGSKITM